MLNSLPFTGCFRPAKARRAAFGLVLTALAMLCVSCVSPGPATEYFSLFALNGANPGSSEILDKSLSFGVGPIVIPEYLEKSNIVSVSKGPRVQVSDRNAWAGELKAAMGRVLADNLAQLWQLDKVSAFPWDNRVRPTYQIRLVFDEFDGQRGGEVHLRVAWSLLNQRGDTLYLSRRAAFTVSTADATAATYVAALNSLLNQFSRELAVAVKQFLQQKAE